MIKSQITYSTLVGLLLFSDYLSAQFVTISPEFPVINDEMTLTFDVTQSTDSRAEGLLGLTDDVFLWAGAGDDENAFKYEPQDQDDFFEPFLPGKLTSLGNDKWEITFIPKEYFDIPPSVKITRAHQKKVSECILRPFLLGFTKSRLLMCLLTASTIEFD